MTEKDLFGPAEGDVAKVSPTPELEEPDELAALQTNYMRLAADFDNYRKRSRRQIEDIIARANEELLTRLLPVLDNFCIAIGALPDTPEREGMQIIYEQLIGVLQEHGVVMIKAEGCTFDPAVHEAVAHALNPELPDDAVVEELRKGYMLGGKVIRPSAVMVNKKEGGCYK